jgi:hypothetical protein
MQQQTCHAVPDDGLEPQMFPVPTAESTYEGPLGALSYRQAQALAVTVTALVLFAAVLVCNLVAWAL